MPRRKTTVRRAGPGGVPEPSTAVGRLRQLAVAYQDLEGQKKMAVERQEALSNEALLLLTEASLEEVEAQDGSWIKRVAVKTVTKSTVDPAKLWDVLAERDQIAFFDSVKVIQAEAKKYITGRELDKIIERIPGGPTGEEKATFGKRAKK